ncbi:hypothetical protein [Pseudoxanthomonas koreensis]|uniref:portal protein n=1 Tax=Pseudoxanthomonas koreensis TaxID=266061 RepID=UPI001391E621|nr:hypothetical protein [Pseudoxanthomonas koreensis]KAF1692660.1 hypothetical protein CSC64_06640 [Pseudoxanthomonas koreensis]
MEQGKEAPDVDKLVKQFEESQDQGRENRELSERDRDYYDGYQLTDEEIATLQSRGQPPVVFNRIAPKVDAVLGFERRMRTDPKAYPRTPKHEDEANSVTDAIRYVLDDQRWDQKRSDVAENGFVEGAGAITVTVAQGRSGIDVILTHVPWDRFYFDPYSRTRDFSDAAYMGVVVWMDEDDVEAKWGEEGVKLATACLDSSDWSGDTYDDRPRYTAWADAKRRRVRVCQHYWRKAGVWHTAIFCRAGYLEEPAVSPYLDEDDQPSCPLIAVSCYIDRENNRYGGVRRMISPQDEINKRRSKALHYLNSRQVIAEHGAVENIGKAKEELARPDGWVEVNPESKIEIQPNVQMAAGEMQLLAEAKAEIDASGVNPALEGDVNAPSGRAVEALQQAGLAELTKFFDAQRDWGWRVYRAVWNRIRQYWDEERWIRVTDDENNLRWVALNKPVTVEDEVRKLVEAGQPVPPQLEQAFMANPQAVVRMSNPVADLDVDIVMQDAPDSVNIQSEQFQMLTEMWSKAPDRIPLEMVIEASTLRNKEQLLEHLKSQQQPNPLMERKATADVAKTESEAAKNFAAAEKDAADANATTQQSNVQAVQAHLAAEFGTPVPLIGV